MTSLNINIVNVLIVKEMNDELDQETTEYLTSKLCVCLLDVTQGCHQLLAGDWLLVLQQVPVNSNTHHHTHHTGLCLTAAELKKATFLTRAHLCAISLSSLVSTLASDVIPATLHAMSLQANEEKTEMFLLCISDHLFKTHVLESIR